MATKTLAKLSLVAAVAAQLAAGIPAPAAAQGALVDTYLSPTYGYTLAYDASWEVTSTTSSGGEDVLWLDNGVTRAAFYAYPSTGGVQDCIEADLAWLRNQSGVRDVAPMLDPQGVPVAGGDASDAFAVFSYQDVGNTGVTGERVAFIECVALGPAEAMLEITAMAPAPGQADEVMALTAGLDLSSQAGQGSQGGQGGEGGDSLFGEDGQDGQSGQVIAGGAGGVGGTGESADADLAVFVGDVSADLEAFWTETFEANGLYYLDAGYVVVDQEPIANPCLGQGVVAGVGSHYCGANQVVYFDAAQELQGAAAVGTVSLVYTLAHETGHHVEMQLGLLFEQRSVEAELTADCLAGAYVADAQARGLVAAEEIDALLPLIGAIGDEDAGMTANEAGSHGLGGQRQAMFLRGLSSGIAGCSVPVA